MKFNKALKSVLVATVAAVTLLSSAPCANAESKRIEIPSGSADIPDAVLDVSCTLREGETVVVATMTPNDLSAVRMGSASIDIFFAANSEPLPVSCNSTPEGQPARLIGLYAGYVNQVLLRGSFSATIGEGEALKVISYPVSGVSVGCSL